MNEKRKLKRRHLIFYLRVFKQNSNQLIGYLVDITPEGVMLISEDPIETEKAYKLKMVLPAEIGKKKHLNFEAKSIWCKLDVNTDFYDTGFKLIEIADADKDIIEKLIQEFGFND